MTSGLQGIYLFLPLEYIHDVHGGGQTSPATGRRQPMPWRPAPWEAAVTLQSRVPLSQDRCPSLYLGSDLGQKYSFIRTFSMCIHTFSIFIHINIQRWVIPGGPVVKNPSADAGDTGSLRGLGTKIPPAVGQLNSSHAREPSCRTSEAPRPQASWSATWEDTALRSPHTAIREYSPFATTRDSLRTAMKSPCVTMKTQGSQK